MRYFSYLYSNRHFSYLYSYSHASPSLLRQADVHESTTLDHIKEEEPEFYSMVTRVLKRAEAEFGLWVGHQSDWSSAAVVLLDQPADEALNSILCDPFWEYLTVTLRWKRCAGLVFCSWTMSFLSSWSLPLIVSYVSIFPVNLILEPSKPRDIFLVIWWAEPFLMRFASCRGRPRCTSSELMICKESFAESSRDQGSWSCKKGQWPDPLAGVVREAESAACIFCWEASRSYQHPVHSAAPSTHCPKTRSWVDGFESFKSCVVCGTVWLVYEWNVGTRASCLADPVWSGSKAWGKSSGRVMWNRSFLGVKNTSCGLSMRSAFPFTKSFSH